MLFCTWQVGVSHCRAVASGARTVAHRARTDGATMDDRTRARPRRAATPELLEVPVSPMAREVVNGTGRDLMNVSLLERAMARHWNAVAIGARTVAHRARTDGATMGNRDDGNSERQWRAPSALSPPGCAARGTSGRDCPCAASGCSDRWCPRIRRENGPRSAGNAPLAPFLARLTVFCSSSRPLARPVTARAGSPAPGCARHARHRTRQPLSLCLRSNSISRWAASWIRSRETNRSTRSRGRICGHGRVSPSLLATTPGRSIVRHGSRTVASGCSNQWRKPLATDPCLTLGHRALLRCRRSLNTLRRRRRVVAASPAARCATPKGSARGLLHHPVGHDLDKTQWAQPLELADGSASAPSAHAAE